MCITGFLLCIQPAFNKFLLNTSYMLDLTESDRVVGLDKSKIKIKMVLYSWNLYSSNTHFHYVFLFDSVS